MQGDLDIWHVKVVLQYERTKGKAIPLQAWRGGEDPRSLRFPDFKTIGT